jgi:hypothetical protein
LESSTLIDLVRTFRDEVGEPYVLTEQVIFPNGFTKPITPRAGGYYVLKKYLGRCLTTPAAEKERVIRELHNGWVDFADHAGRRHEPVREYARMTIGMSLLLLYNTLDEVKAGKGLEFAPVMGESGVKIRTGRDFAADAIVRASRWFQTRSNLWIYPRHYVDTLVRTIWGNVEDLIRIHGISAQGGRTKRVRTREKARCPRCLEVVDYDGPLRERCGACKDDPTDDLTVYEIPDLEATE